MKKSLIAMSLVLAFGAANAASAVTNGSFETSNVAAGSFAYAPTVVAPDWTFGTGSGVATNNSAWGGTALDGNSYAFLQMANASVSQTFNGGAGTYTIDFSLAQRSGMAYSGAQSISVYLDNVALNLTGQQNGSVLYPPLFAATGAGGWTDYSFSVASATAGAHTLSFVGLGYQGQDTTVFLDKVSVAAPVPEPETYAMLLAGLGLMGVIARRRNKSKA